MKKIDLICAVSQRTGVPKEIVLKSLNATLVVIAETMARGEEIRLKRFGTFRVLPRHATQRSHRYTRELIQVPRKVIPRFYPGKFLKKLVEEQLTVVQLPSGRLTVCRREHLR